MKLPLRRLFGRQSHVDALDALTDRVARVEEQAKALRDQAAVLWALAPTWLTEPIPHAQARGWDVRATPSAILFEHERGDECRIKLPLPVDPAEHIAVQRDLYMRLDYSGPSGLERIKELTQARPRIVDLPERGAYA